MLKILRPLGRYADFEGRSDRSEFWLFFSPSALVFVVTIFGSLVDAQIGKTSDPAAAPPRAIIAYLLWWLITAVPWFALQARRFHDIGLSGWFALINGGAYLALLMAPPIGLALFALSLLLMARPSKTPRESAPEEWQSNDGQGFSPPLSADASSNALRFHEAEAGPDADIVVQRNGRFVAGGFSFKTEKQARDFAERRNKPLGSTMPQAAPSDRETANRAMSGNSDTSDPDVKRTPEGRYLTGGFSYSSFEQARFEAERMRRPAFSAATLAASPIASRTASPIIPPAASPAAPPAASPITPPAASPAAPPAASQAFPPEQHEVRATNDGRFACAGYIFSTFDQAQRYADRRRDAATPQVRSLAAPLRPQPLQPAAPAFPSPPENKAPSTGLRGLFSALSSPSPALAPRQAPAPVCGPERWIGVATPVTVGNIGFDAELLYFGTPKSSEDHHRALVDPSLPLGQLADRDGNSLGYWPHFSEIQPGARRAYIEWLADGRRDPATPIGYVFLYFYGLERRLIKARAADEADTILGELDRLMGIYGSNYSFAGYARSLIDAANVLHGAPPEELAASLDLRQGWEMPLGVRLYLGKKVAAGEPIGAEDALCWTLAHPEIYPRTPVRRCFADFKALWHHEFAERFQAGIKVAKPKTRLKYRYRSASGEFNAAAPIGDLPDITAVSAPVARFQQLLNDCTDALDPLSRFLGRNPDEEGTVLAVALAPSAIRMRDGQSRYAQARNQLTERTAETGFTPIRLAALLDILAGSGTTKGAEQRQSHRKRLSEILDAMGLGFEPDKRFGPAPTLAEDITLCLFAKPDGAAASGGRRYDVARTMVEVAVLAAQADSLVVEAELESIVRDLAALNELGEAERSRLEAHMHALVHNPPKLRAATKRVADLSAADKEMVLQSVINAVLADQRITPTEVRFLEGLYKLLGKPQDEVYSRLHSGPGPSTPAPRPEKAAKQAARDIDGDKLARIREETAAVSTMLASIFTEEEPDPEPAEPAPANEPSLFAGLDAQHSHLLLALIAAPLEADAFASLCKREKLLPGGAIETINDWAFDILDEVAIEDDDIYCLQPHILATLKEMTGRP